MMPTISEIALALSRWVELSILSKATILLVLGLAATWAAGRARASVRHLLLAATFCALLTLPVVLVTAPQIAIPIAPSAPSTLVTDVATTPVSGAPVRSEGGSVVSAEGRATRFSFPTMLRWVWISGALLLLAPLGVDLWRLRRIRRTGLPWPESRGFTQSLAAERGVCRNVEVLLHEELPAPVTCGVWHPAIVLPADAREWSEEDLRRALVHELEHVRRGDWLTQLTARAGCACYWFHPLVWVAWRRLMLEAERACDDAVVQSSESADYAEQLVALARRMSAAHAQPALGMANRSDLSARVAAVLDCRQRRGRAGLFAAVSAIAAASLIVFAIAPLRAVAQSSSPGRAPAALDRALYEAADEGDVAGIEDLLRAGANVNCAIAGDGSPLIGAARNGYVEAVRLLLERGADVNMAVAGDGNPLIKAAREGHADVVTLLLDRGARVDEVVPGDENALIQASGEGELRVVQLLVARSANVNSRVWANSVEWRTPLNMARKGGHERVVAFLLSAGARQ